MKKIIITSGYFNPAHIGHINLLKKAKELGDFLVVIVNSDKQVRVKGAIPFMPEKERLEIIRSIKYVDQVVMAIDEDRSVAKSLRMVARLYPGELVFAKGGDRNSSNIPESERKACKECKIKIINRVGGKKVQSSSWLLNNSRRPKTKK